jgi:ketosteroid isomerase-like protein
LTREAAEIVRATVDAFNRHDTAGFLEGLDEDVEWVPLRAVLDGDVYRGHSGARRFVADMDEDMEGRQIRLDEVFEVGAYVVAYGAVTGKGRGSGMDLEFPIGWVVGLSGGRISYLRAYTEREDALKAAQDAESGLEQPLGPPARAVDS